MAAWKSVFAPSSHGCQPPDPRPGPGHELSCLSPPLGGMCVYDQRRLLMKGLGPRERASLPPRTKRHPSLLLGIPR